MSRLHFTESTHRYSLDAEWVPSVSSIKNRAGDSNGLIAAAAKAAASWAATHAAELDLMGEADWVAQCATAHRRAWDASALVGKQVHSIAERLVYGDPVETHDPTTGEEYPDDVVRMGAQVARFMDRWDVTPDTALVECPVFHDELRYAGTFDLCAVLRGGQRWMIDYKSGATGIYAETALQTTAYARATHIVIGERDLLMPPVDRCAALWVRPDSWELIPVRSDAHVWEWFRSLLRARTLELQRKDAVAAPLPVPAA